MNVRIEIQRPGSATSFPGCAWERAAIEALPRTWRQLRRRYFAAGGACRSRRSQAEPGNERRRSGLSLFEVIVALAIFMGSIAAIGQLVSNGVRGAVQAKLQSQATLRAETKMAEVVAGLVPLHGGMGGTFPDDPTWSWSVMSVGGSQEGLYFVEVTATHAAVASAGKQSYTLRRLVRDPQIELAAYEKQQADAAAAASNGSGNSSSGSGGSGAGK
jgi:general secretion pathway protein I